MRQRNIMRQRIVRQKYYAIQDINFSQNDNLFKSLSWFKLEVLG